MRFGRKIWIGLRGNLFSSVMLFLVTAILSMAVFTAGYFRQIYHSFFYQVVESEGYSIGIENENGVSDEALERVMNEEGAVGYNNAGTQTVRCVPVDFRNISYEESEQAGGDPESALLSYLPKTEEITLCGSRNPAYHILFANGSLELTAGAWPERGSSEVLLDTVLCEKNHLRIGDQIAVVSAYDNQVYHFRICGMYVTHDAPTEKGYLNGEACELKAGSSYIFCTEEIWSNVSGRQISDSLFDVYAGDAKAQKKLYARVRELLEPEYVVYDNMLSRVQDHYSMLYSLKLFSGLCFGLVLVLSGILSGLMLVYWMQGQQKEAGIFLELGMEERQVRVIVLARTMLITAAALIMSSALSIAAELLWGDRIRELYLSLSIIPDRSHYGKSLFDVNGYGWILENNGLFFVYLLILSYFVSAFLLIYKNRK